MGIDPVYERLPPTIRGDNSSNELLSRVEAVERFCRGVLDAVAPHVPCVKIQSACFERYLWHGVELYHRLVQQARALDLIVIGDAKRGDVGFSSEHYAAGCLGDQTFGGFADLEGPDAITVNSYMGIDAIEPFISLASSQGKGLFVLVRTSNPGSDAVQSLKLDDGRNVCDAVAEMVSDTGGTPGLVGASGYSLLGAVVGATKREDIVRLRRIMPKQIFLVPGYGPQGANADDMRGCFNDDGAGAIISASRSVLYASEKTPGGWLKAVAQAAADLNQQIRSILV